MPALKPGMCVGLDVDSVAKLKSNNVYSVEDLLCSDVENLVAICGIHYKDIVGIRRVLLAEYSAIPECGTDIYEDKLSGTSIISSGFKSLDDILDGGFYSSEITEVFGAPGIGKSQICLRSSMNIAIETGQNVVYFDTSGNFSLQWIQDYLESINIGTSVAKSVCSRIQIIPVFDLYELLDAINFVKVKILEQIESFYSRVKLFVLDSAAAIVRPELGGKLSDGNGMMVHLSQDLKSLAAECCIAVLVTNNAVVTDENVSQPSLGKSWHTIPNLRLQLISNEVPSERLCIIHKSLRQACGLTTMVHLETKYI